MTSNGEMSAGEIGRSLQRIEASMTELRNELRDRSHKLTNELNGLVGPISMLKVQMTNAEHNLIRLDNEVNDVTRTANRIAGAGAFLAVLAGLIPLPWRK